MKLKKATEKASLRKIENLYTQAFPIEERKNFSLLLKKQEQGVLEILAVESSDHEFLGLAITIPCDDMTLLDYFAISPKLRGRGMGTEAFHLIKERYQNQKFILEIENPNIDAPNRMQRFKRKQFYLRNGMNHIPFLVKIAGVEMEVLTPEPGLSFENYRRIYDMAYKPEITREVILLELYEI